MTFFIPMWLLWILVPSVIVALAILGFFAWCGYQLVTMFWGGVR